MPNRDDQSRDDNFIKGYEPLTEGYTPDDEQSALPEPPTGGSGQSSGSEGGGENQGGD